MTPRICEVNACERQILVRLLKDIVEAYDSKILEMRSPEISDPLNDIPMHEWHEEWLYFARDAIKG